MEKTKEQKLASKQRYIAQENKAIEMLRSDSLYYFIDGLKYAYSLCLRYRKNLRNFLEEDALFINPFKETYKDDNVTPLDKCLRAGILKPWNDTYWFDKDKAASLQQYILENTTN